MNTGENHLGAGNELLGVDEVLEEGVFVPRYAFLLVLVRVRIAAHSH